MSLNIEWCTELYPSKEEDNFGVAGDFAVVRLDELAVFLGDIDDTLDTLVNLIPDIGKLSRVQAIRRELADLEAQAKEATR